MTREQLTRGVAAPPEKGTLVEQVGHCLAVLLFFSLLYIIYFSPILWHNRLLAPGEGWFQSFQAFAAKRTLWTPLLWTGYPAAADPTMQSWYPLALFFSKVVNSWNAFVVSAYVLASSFTYGLVYSLTRHRLAGLAGGIIFGMSAVMIVHLAHTSMIHTAAWLPLLAWSLTQLRSGANRQWWFLASSVSVACSILAGHPQILVYSLSLGGVYILFLTFSEKEDRRRYVALSIASMALGAGLAAVQLLPTAELTSLSHRAALSYDDFISYALHPLQTVEMLFPNLFGGVPGYFYQYGYFGVWNLAEVAGYVGLLPLLIAPAALLRGRQKRATWFWCCIGSSAFLLSLGGSTPLAKLIYHIPALNKFRAPGRHLFEMALAVSILTGLGIRAIHEQMVSRRLIIKTVVAGIVIMTAGLILIVLFSPRLQALMSSRGMPHVDFLPWSNRAVGIPFIIYVLSALSLIAWTGNVQSRARQFLLIAALIVDLGSFGWLAEWRYYSPDKKIMETSPTIGKYKQLLNDQQQRLLPVRGDSTLEVEVRPNISRFRGVPSISGYGPFIPPRLGELASMGTTGQVSGDWALPKNQGLNILATRFILFRQGDIRMPAPLKNDEVFSRENMDIMLGAGCGINHPREAEFSMPAPTTASSLHVVSSLACSTSTVQDRPVVEISIEGPGNKPRKVQLVAGRNTAEWAYDCGDVRPLMKHGLAAIYESFPVVRESKEACQGHRYAARFAFDGPTRVSKVRLRWTGETESISIHKISLRDDASGVSYPLDVTAGAIANTEHWRHVEDVGDTSIYENLRAMPRAWLVPAAVSLKPEEILKTIKASMLPDGNIFDPAAVALVEEPTSFRDGRSGGQAHVVHIDDTRVEIMTDSASSAFLILSDLYYPGWHATIDGNPTHLYRTDYVLRGAMVPAGGHTVRFEYSPRSFYVGLGISAVSLIAIFVLLFYIGKRRTA